MAALLTPAEHRLWSVMSGPDRRHAVAVARAVSQTLGARANEPVLAAALLHDVGKIDAGLGTFARVPATVLGMVAHRRLAVGQGRIARYLRHDDIGRRLLVEAGSDSLVSTWAGEHHLPAERWTIPTAVAGVLKAADND